MTCNVRSAVIYVFYLDFLNSFCAIASRFTHLTDCYIQCFLFFGLFIIIIIIIRNSHRQSDSYLLQGHSGYMCFKGFKTTHYIF